MPAIEAYHSTLEFELRARERFATKAQARNGVAAWIDYYNRERRHSACRMLSPDQLRVGHRARWPEMHPLLGFPSIARCSGLSRSFHAGPGGPTGAPPGQPLRAGAVIETENQENKITTLESPQFEGILN
jgi:integrase-like protein